MVPLSHNMFKVLKKNKKKTVGPSIFIDTSRSIALGEKIVDLILIKKKFQRIGSDHRHTYTIYVGEPMVAPL